MADSTDTSVATNARVITKKVAVEICDFAMRQIAGVYYNAAPLVRVIDDSFTEPQAAAAAAAMGATVQFLTSPLVNNVGRRVAVMRVSVGLITSSLTAESLAASYPQEMVQVESVAQEAGLANVSLPILKAAVGTPDFVQLAKQINSTAPVVGDSVLEQAPSRVAANFNVIFSVINIIQLLQSEDETTARQQQLGTNECGQIMRQAHEAAWKKVENIFHQKSYKTETGVKRYHGKKKSRRN